VALTLAASNGHTETVEVLRAHMARQQRDPAAPRRPAL
jgi:hypothetical protein